MGKIFDSIIGGLNKLSELPISIKFSSGSNRSHEQNNSLFNIGFGKDSDSYDNYNRQHDCGRDDYSDFNKFEKFQEFEKFQKFQKFQEYGNDRSHEQSGRNGRYNNDRYDYCPMNEVQLRPYSVNPDWRNGPNMFDNNHDRHGRDNDNVNRIVIRGDMTDKRIRIINP